MLGMSGHGDPDIQWWLEVEATKSEVRKPRLPWVVCNGGWEVCREREACRGTETPTYNGRVLGFWSSKAGLPWEAKWGVGVSCGVMSIS